MPIKQDNRGSSGRDFGSMDEEKRRDVASKGGKAGQGHDNEDHGRAHRDR